ncbi:hypothetical protein F1188_14960 [Roseospira marina]|uniref:DNA-binding protein n=1 Tax=Roseospira marina TaxID=140057 RepID=A0A5M6I8W6_9PROT|nr:hypothetical protein [Roseospira marina]KAA5604710.1 hypothetical protein F1188_14960 [Roseospira marina]MBB4315158.1 hypothetical protein [Roseospira marina]MBB5088072.1 hypothetical protein [Roseospira marina]
MGAVSTDSRPLGPTLMTVVEAARAVHPDMAPRVFQATADRLGIRYHRLGRSRYYSTEAIRQVIEGTTQCPDVEPARDSGGGAANGSSGGLSTETAVSVAQARQIAARLKKPSKHSSRNAESGPPANVLPIRP